MELLNNLSAKQIRSILKTDSISYAHRDVDLRISGKDWASSEDNTGLVTFRATFYEGEFKYSPLLVGSHPYDGSDVKSTTYVCSLDCGLKSATINISCNPSDAGKGYGRLLMNLVIQFTRLCLPPETKITGLIGDRGNDPYHDTQREGWFWASLGAKYSTNSLEMYVEDLVIRETANGRMTTKGGIPYALPLSRFSPNQNRLFPLPAKDVLAIPARGLLNQLQQNYATLQERSNAHNSKFLVKLQKVFFLDPVDPHFPNTNKMHLISSDSLKFELAQFPFVEMYLNHWFKKYLGGSYPFVPWSVVNFDGRSYTFLSNTLNAIIKVQERLKADGYC